MPNDGLAGVSTSVETPAPTPQVGNEPQVQTPSTSEGPKAEPEKTFTQSELDEILEKRLAKERRRNEQRYVQVLERALGNQQQAANTPVASEAPKRENFKSDDEYALAVVDFRAEKKAGEIIEKREREQAAKKAQEDQRRVDSEFAKRVEKARGKHDDFDDVIGDPDLTITDAMAKAIKSDPNGPDIAYYLGTHKDEAARIAALSSEQAGLELGRLSTKFDQPNALKTPSAAPAPIEPVGKSRTSAASDEPSDKDDAETWLRKRNAQVKARQGR